jgi:hypothetical protein
MILEHMETGLRVRVVEEKDERTVTNAYGTTTKVVVQSRLMTEGGQPVRAKLDGPEPLLYLVGTRYGIVGMFRVYE